MAVERNRCWWCGEDPEYVAYHDNEWGRPTSDTQKLFEKICLEGFQAGLSWLTILRKRENFRRAFHGFEPQRVAQMTPSDVDVLMLDAGIVRHRGKIESTINNARQLPDLEQEFGSLAAFVWSFEPAAAQRPDRITRDTVRSLGQTEASRGLSKALKKRGWGFVGPTTMYALLQACGVVNDHIETCAWRALVEKDRSLFTRP